MEFLYVSLPIVLYILSIVLIVVLIVLGIRLINTLDKVDVLIDDTNQKMKVLDRFFKILDRTADRIVNLNDFFVDTISSGIVNLFSFGKRRKKKESDYDE